MEIARRRCCAIAGKLGRPAARSGPNVWKRRDEYVAIAERDRWRIGANRHAAPTEARPDLRARSPARRSAGERDAVGGTATNTQST
jgi:hypothetical protein